MTKTWLGVHTLRIQTGKYENKGASIPAEERLCLVYKRNCIEDEKHFLIDCTEYNSLRQKLYFWNDANFINLTDHARTIYLLRLDNDNTSQVIAKYAHLLFQKRKQILIVVSVHILYEFVVVMKTFIVTRPMPSFWRVRRNKDILYFTILHYTILHYTTTTAATATATAYHYHFLKHCSSHLHYSTLSTVTTSFSSNASSAPTTEDHKWREL